MAAHYTGKINLKLRPTLQGSFSSTPRSAQRVATEVGVVHEHRFLDELGSGVAPPSFGPLDDLSRWHTVQLAGTSTDQALLRNEVWDAIHRLLEQPEVEWAEPDAILEGTVPPAHFGAASQGQTYPKDWHLQVIGAPEAWALCRAGGLEPGAGVVIAHLDTGYTAHEAVPRERFVNPGMDLWDRSRPDASDPLDAGLGKMPGHGTGTLCLLAANHANYQGVAVASRVLPLRISNSVLHVASRSMALGIVNATVSGANVITISMGGLPSKLWADAVNRAYDLGVVICAAAGNNFPLLGGLRTPTRVVYPARFNRVIACAGVTHAEQRYWFSDRMSGNYGPEVDICAPTPDVHWASPSPSGKEYDPHGAGTSTATPQVAGTAALWLSYHRDELAAFSPVEAVEACRWALIQGARDVGTYPYQPMEEGRTHNEIFGDGCLSAIATLEIPPRRGLRPQSPDDVSWALLKMLGAFSATPGFGESLADQIELLWTTEVEADLRSAIVDSSTAAARSKIRERIGGDN